MAFFFSRGGGSALRYDGASDRLPIKSHGMSRPLSWDGDPDLAVPEGAVDGGLNGGFFFDEGECAAALVGSHVRFEMQSCSV